MEKRNVESINPSKYNPRNISIEDFENLKKSLIQYGCVRPLIINKKSDILVSGHQTLKAAKEIGLKEVPVLYVDLDEINEKKLNIALNKISGEWDYGKLNEIIGSLDNLEYTGFSEKEVNAFADFSFGEGGNFEKQGIVGEISEERTPLSFYVPKKEWLWLHNYFGGVANHDIKKLKKVALLGKKNGIKFNGDLLNPVTSNEKEFNKLKKIIKVAQKNGIV